MPLTFFFTVADPDDDKSIISLPVDESLDDLTADYMLKYAWDIINPLINGTLVTAGFTYETDISTWTNAAAAAIADVQEAAEFVYRAVGDAGSFIKRITLPTFIETFFTGSGAGKEVDVTQSAVTAFNTMIVDGIKHSDIDVAPAPVVTDHNEDITAFLKGRQKWGKNRR